MTAHTLLVLFQLSIWSAASKTHELNPEEATRFARLALACVEKEYPNKLSHTLNSDADVKPPRQLTPAFYGCYDWHSSVHGHWLLARLARMFPDASFAADACAASPNPTFVRRSPTCRRRGGPASSARTGSPGCCSLASSCASGRKGRTARSRVSSRRIYSRWSRQPSSD